MDQQAFVAWLKQLKWYGSGFQKDEKEKVAKVYSSLDRFRLYLNERWGISSIEETTLASLQGFDFRDKDDDDLHLRFVFSFLDRKDLIAYIDEISADKYFRRKMLTGIFKNMPEYTEAIKALGKSRIRMASELLKQGAAPQGRKILAAQTGLPEQTLLKMVHCCDLCRMTGMSGQALRRSVGMGFDTLAKFKAATPQDVRDTLQRFLAENNDRIGGDMLDYGYFTDQARKLADIVIV